MSVPSSLHSCSAFATITRALSPCSNSLDNTPSSSLEAVAATANTTVIAPRQWVDSDDECLGDEDWASQIAADLLQTLTDAEKKRQEIINGKFPCFLSQIKARL